MPQKRDRFKKLTDLFVEGKHVRLPDGTYLWVQVLNTYEREECLSAAQVARARLVMALREKGEERVKVMGHIAEVGHAAIAHELADLKVEDSLYRLASNIRDDPDWAERMKIIDETDLSDAASRLTADELDLLDKLQVQFFEEVTRRRDDERELALVEFQAMSDEEIEEAYLEAWLDKRGTAAGNNEYNLVEMMLATRYSDAIDVDGQPDISEGDSRGERVFDTLEEARAAPAQLQKVIRDALSDLAMGDRDPKGSGSRPGSSDSSSTPSEPGESMPSTSTETQPSPPGTSSQPSLTH